MAETADQLRSRGEAHLYVAVAKADGAMSLNEKTQLPYLARRSQKRYNILGTNDKIKETIRSDIIAITGSEETRGWTAEMHVDEGIACLRRAIEHGATGVELTAHKVEEELYALAHMGGYDIRESRFVRDVVNRLEELDRAEGSKGS